MRLVIALLLGIQTIFASDLDTSDGTSTITTFTCDDGEEPGLRNDTNCYCTCTRYEKAAICTSLDDVISYFADGSNSDRGTTTSDIKDVVEAIRDECIDSNPNLDSTICSDSELTFNTDAKTCECPTCDQSSTCTFLDTYEIYRCDGTLCKRKKATCTRDEYGNIIATEEFTGDAVDDDESKCPYICDDGSDTNTDECTRGEMGDDGCFYPCYEDDDGVNRLSDTAKSVSDVIAGADYSAIYTKWCQWRNTELRNCSDANILATTTGCGCGKCVEACEYEKRYAYYKDGDRIICRLTTCTEETVSVTASTDTSNVALSRITDDITYDNIRRRITTKEVDIKYCINPDEDKETTETPEDPCDDPCARYELIDVDPSICVYDSDGEVLRTFDCPLQFRCALADASDRYEYRYAGRCKKTTDTTDECELGDMKVSDRRTPRSKCPLICKCVENPFSDDDNSYGNIWVCDTMERNWVNFKSRCAAKLGADECTFDRAYFPVCPSTDDDDICDVFTCSYDDDDVEDPNDPTKGGLCRKSSEGFANTTITKRDDSVGCKYDECDDDGSLVSRRYDVDITRDDIDISTRIPEACTKLNDCRNVTRYDTRELCGVCPICNDDTDNDDACDRNTLRKGDRACIEDPLDNDDTGRPEDDEVDALVKVTFGVRICADSFFEYERDEIYTRIKKALISVARDECSATITDFSNLRASITAFTFDVVDKDGDNCDVVLRVVVTVTFGDIDRATLKKLVTCLEGLDLNVKIVVALIDATKGDRLTDDGEVNTDGIDATKDTSYAATVVATETDGTVLKTETTTTSTTKTPVDEMSDANPYALMAVVIASFMAMIF